MKILLKRGFYIIGVGGYVYVFVMCKTEDLGNGKGKRFKMYCMR